MSSYICVAVIRFAPSLLFRSFVNNAVQCPSRSRYASILGASCSLFDCRLWRYSWKHPRSFLFDIRRLIVYSIHISMIRRITRCWKPPYPMEQIRFCLHRPSTIYFLSSVAFFNLGLALLVSSALYQRLPVSQYYYQLNGLGVSDEAFGDLF